MILNIDLMNNLQKKTIKHLRKINRKQKQILVDMISVLNSGKSLRAGWETKLMNDIEDVEEWLSAVIEDEDIE